jgi:hypothetical protein
MQATTQTEPAIIQIDVAREDRGPFLSGTFNQPPGLVRVRRKTNIQWQLKKADERDSFIVSFANGSPFVGVSAIGDRTPPLPALNTGSFHYQVFVVDGVSALVYAIQSCPEVQVDGSDDD